MYRMTAQKVLSRHRVLRPTILEKRFANHPTYFSYLGDSAFLGYY